jgi:predicted DNA-binding transcriptional regulator AlpA
MRYCTHAIEHGRAHSRTYLVKGEEERQVKNNSETEAAGPDTTSGPKVEKDRKLLLRAAEFGALIGTSERWIWDKHNAGNLPRPVRIGRLVRWRRSDIEAWIEAGCPDCSKAERLDDLHKRLKNRP